MIEYVDTTGSTNADLAARIAAGSPPQEGYWLLARRQTAGRGRQGRAWDDGEGNFMGSTVLELGEASSSTANPASLAFPVSLALHRSIAAFLPRSDALMLKWPNDVLLDGAKVSGMLMERIGSHIVIGIGVNLASAPQLADRATTSLARVAPVPHLDDFAKALARNFGDEIARWRSAGLAQQRRRWLDFAHPEGSPLSINSAPSETISGRFAGLDTDGALQLRLADGSLRTIHAGDVSLMAERR